MWFMCWKIVDELTQSIQARDLHVTKTPFIQSTYFPLIQYLTSTNLITLLKPRVYLLSNKRYVFTYTPHMSFSTFSQFSYMSLLSRFVSFYLNDKKKSYPAIWNFFLVQIKSIIFDIFISNTKFQYNKYSIGKTKYFLSFFSGLKISSKNIL